MNNSVRGFAFLFIITILTGLIYPFLVLGIGFLFFPHQARGSLLIKENSLPAGSFLIGQRFVKNQFFWPRFSATEWNAMPGTGSHIPLFGKELYEAMKTRPAYDGIETLKFASASGVDPHISKKEALLQVPRIAKTRGWEEKKIEDMIHSVCEGIFHKQYVNVLTLNNMLEEHAALEKGTKL